MRIDMRSWWRKTCAGGAGLCAAWPTTGLQRFSDFGVVPDLVTYSTGWEILDRQVKIWPREFGFDVVARTRSGPRGSSVAGPRLQLVHGRLRHARAARRQGAAGPIGVNKFGDIAIKAPPKTVRRR